MSIHAPYNFVPLSRFIYLPHWADQVSHDVPFSDGISGTLNIELTCHTPILVGGKRIKTPDNEPDIVEFCKDPNDNPIIQPTTIKGMFSNVLEISSFARFNRLDNKRYSVRDLSSANNFYLRQFPNTPKSGKGGRPGWLRFNQDSTQWEITPCQSARIKHDKIIDHFKHITVENWTNETNNKAYKRYELLGGILELNFDSAVRVIKPKQGPELEMLVANPTKSGKYKGHLVVTGQPGKPFNAKPLDNKNSYKKWEFVFFNSDQQAINIEQKVIQDFLFIHSESDDWKYWRKNPNRSKSTGIPVFYTTQGNKISSIGLSSLYRLAYPKTTHETVEHTHISHISRDEPDLPEIMFGRISDNGTSYKGRINFSIGTCVGLPHYATHLSSPTILNGPKPTYYPAYIRQPNANNDGMLSKPNDFKTMMNGDSELSGWKRYPVHNSADVTVTKNKQDKGAKNNTKVILKPIDKNSRFTFNVHFHNLRDVELGALLWTINFGDRTDSFHTLGMGKPYGLGRVSMKLKSATLIPNTPRQYDNQTLIEKCKTSFTKLMTDAYSFVTTEHSWEESPQLIELFEMSRINSDSALKYMPLDAFADSKGQSRQRDNKKYESLPSYSHSPFKHLTISKNTPSTVDLRVKLYPDETFLQDKESGIALLQKQKNKAALKNEKAQALENADQGKQAFTSFKYSREYYLESQSNSSHNDLKKDMEKLKKDVDAGLLTLAELEECYLLLEALPNSKQKEKLIKSLDKKKGV